MAPGESDVPLLTAPDYQRRLDALFEDLRARYGPELPIIVGGMVPEEMEHSGKDYRPINAVHEDTPRRLPRTAFVPGHRNAFNSDTDRHYNASGVRAMGSDMWEPTGSSTPTDSIATGAEGRPRSDAGAPPRMTPPNF